MENFLPYWNIKKGKVRQKWSMPHADFWQLKKKTFTFVKFCLYFDLFKHVGFVPHHFLLGWIDALQFILQKNCRAATWRQFVMSALINLQALRRPSLCSGATPGWVCLHWSSCAHDSMGWTLLESCFMTYYMNNNSKRTVLCEQQIVKCITVMTLKEFYTVCSMMKYLAERKHKQFHNLEECVDKNRFLLIEVSRLSHFT